MTTAKHLPLLTEDVRITDEGTMARFTLPSLSCDIFSDNGDIPVWKFSKMFECSRVFAISHPDFCIMKELPSGQFAFFMKYMDMDLKPDIYSRLKKKGWNMPVAFMVTVSGTGKRSIDFLTLIKDPEDDMLLATVKLRSVLVSFLERKSTFLPGGLKARCSHFLKPEQALEQYVASSHPENAHILFVKVRPSDTDHNGHLNSSVYMQYCVDCASEAAHAGKLQHFHDNMTKYHARRIRTLYLRECLLGDNLAVYCWEDNEDSMVLHFDIINKDKCICQCCIEY